MGDGEFTRGNNEFRLSIVHLMQKHDDLFG